MRNDGYNLIGKHIHCCSRLEFQAKSLLEEHPSLTVTNQNAIRATSSAYLKRIAEENAAILNSLSTYFLKLWASHCGITSYRCPRAVTISRDFPSAPLPFYVEFAAYSRKPETCVFWSSLVWKWTHDNFKQGSPASISKSHFHGQVYTTGKCQWLQKHSREPAIASSSTIGIIWERPFIRDTIPFMIKGALSRA